MLKAYKYRMYPNREQRENLARTFGCARWAYNWALARRNEVYAQTGKTLSIYELNVEMTSVKKENPFLAEVSDWVLKEAIANVGDAFKRFLGAPAATRASSPSATGGSPRPIVA